MTITKRKITEIESIVNKADNRKTAGKIYSFEKIQTKNLIKKRGGRVINMALLSPKPPRISPKARRMIAELYHYSCYQIAKENDWLFLLILIDTYWQFMTVK
jgi:hypothetical protein